MIQVLSSDITTCDKYKILLIQMRRPLAKAKRPKIHGGIQGRIMIH
jgi:hypothetical protein